MSNNQNPCSRFVWPLRVYYEDTDAGGVVYYANYLRFCERARTEWLRSLGVSQRQLLADAGLAFVVRRVEADYLLGAELDDELEVVSTIAKLGAASLTFHQTVQRGDAIVFAAAVSVACVDMARRRATRIPDALRSLLESVA